MWKRFRLTVTSDIKQLCRHPRDIYQSMLFFLVCLSLFGIGGGLSPEHLKVLSPAMIWIVFFITTLWSVETQLRQSHEWGLFEQYLLSAMPLWSLLFAKALVIWCAVILPLILMIPIVGTALQLLPADCFSLLISMLVGSPAVVLLAMLGSVLTLVLPRSGFLLFLILLPLYIPLLILGESVVFQEKLSTDWLSSLALLGGISMLSLTVLPFVIAAALRGAMDD